MTAWSLTAWADGLVPAHRASSSEQIYITFIIGARLSPGRVLRARRAVVADNPLRCSAGPRLDEKFGKL